MRLQNMNFVLIWKHFSCHLLLRLNNHPNLSTYWIMFCASSCDLIIRFQRTSSTVWLSSVLKYFSFQQLHRLTFFFLSSRYHKGAKLLTRRHPAAVTSDLFDFSVVRGLTVCHALDSLNTQYSPGLTGSHVWRLWHMVEVHFLWTHTHTSVILSMRTGIFSVLYKTLSGSKAALNRCFCCLFPYRASHTLIQSVHTTQVSVCVCACVHIYTHMWGPSFTFFLFFFFSYLVFYFFPPSVSCAGDLHVFFLICSVPA